MGNLFVMNRELQSTQPISALPENVYDFESNNFFTAGMSMRYLKPLATPATVAVTATLVKIEGIKIHFGVQIRGEKEVFVTAEGLWIAVPKSVKEEKL
jgi:acyl-CoA thioesterase FadM